MRKGELLSSMLVLTVNGHAGQFDKAGKPYILHPLRVMHRLRTQDEELQCVALGHDLIEDTKTTYQQLREAAMTERIIEGIRCLTKLPGETIDDYKTRVKSNSDAIRVKMEDLRDNSDIRRMKGLSAPDFERLQKYFNFYSELKEFYESNY